MLHPAYWGAAFQGPWEQGYWEDEKSPSSWVSLMPEWQWGDSFQYEETPFAPGDPSSMEELMGGPAQPQTAGRGADLPRARPVLMSPTAEVHSRLAGPCSCLGAALSQRLSVRTAGSRHRARMAGVAAASPPGKRVGVQATAGATQSCQAQGGPGAGQAPLTFWPLPLSYLGFGFGETKDRKSPGAPACPPHPRPPS